MVYPLITCKLVLDMSGPLTWPCQSYLHTLMQHACFGHTKLHVHFASEKSAWVNWRSNIFQVMTNSHVFSPKGKLVLATDSSATSYIWSRSSLLKMTFCRAIWCPPWKSYQMRSILSIPSFLVKTYKVYMIMSIVDESIWIKIGLVWTEPRCSRCQLPTVWTKWSQSKLECVWGWNHLACLQAWLIQ